VDGLRDRLPHAPVHEWVLAKRLAVEISYSRRVRAVLIEVEKNGSPGHGLRDAQRRFLAQPLEVRRRNVFYYVDVACQQRRSTRRIARHCTETHFVPCGRFVPVTVEARQLHTVAARPAYELERPTADHRL